MARAKKTVADVAGDRSGELLDDRTLNRALLARQHLLTRTTEPLPALIEHLVALQAQNPTSPYLALWSRREGFMPAELGALLESRQAVRIGCLRATIHLVMARDVHALRPVVQGVMERNYFSQGQHRRGLEGVDLTELVRHARELLASGPMTNVQLGAKLAERWPSAPAQLIGNAARAFVPLVQIPPRGVWGQSGQPTWDLADHWLAEPVATTAAVGAVHDLVRRYLRVFGPATAADVQTWSGLAGIAEVLERMGGLVTYRNTRGQRLWDVADGLFVDPATPAPPRFLPDYDNLILSHADRARIVSEAVRMRLVRPNMVVPGTVLVDGFVRGTWTFDKPAKKRPGRLTITLLEAVAARLQPALLAEGERFATFLGDGRAPAQRKAQLDRAPEVALAFDL